MDCCWTPIPRVSKMETHLGVVIPAYNEVEALQHTLEEVCRNLRQLEELKLIGAASITVVDDGSVDGTWMLLNTLQSKLSYPLHALRFSRNFGHQYALHAGLMAAAERGVHASISIDADNQHDLSVLPEFLRHYHQGAEVVYGIKRTRQVDSFFKRWTAGFFYQLLQRMGVEIIPQHADYRLMSSDALQILAQYKETSLFLRGLIPALGLASAQVLYDVRERQAGVTKYSLRKMLRLAVDGITSFSVFPLNIIFLLGLFTFCITFFMAIYALWAHLAGHTVSGWTSIVLAIYFLGGTQLISIGVIGIYLGRVYLEVKGRPRYLVKEKF